MRRTATHRSLTSLLTALTLALCLPLVAQAQSSAAEVPPEAASGEPRATAATAAAEEAIRAAYQGLSQAMEASDAARIAQTYYTPEAALFPPGGGPAHGREAIEAVFAGMIESGVVVYPEPVEVEVYGEMAYEYGQATVRNPTGEAVAVEPYMVLWKKGGDGTWRMHRDFVSSTTP